jgi:ABC-type nickel/cobalt efflux system permease component RcnA
MLALFGAWVLGVLLGFRHAFEPDHLSAVATLVTERRDRRAGLWIGALWGLGHTLSLLAVGGALALLERRMPSQVENGFELAVALMLVLLGIRSLVRAAREGRLGVTHAHSHHGHSHAHPGPSAHVHLGRWTFSARPLWVGLVHGLAGSGAMTALAMAAMPSASARLLYIALFGAGSIAGMAVLTGALGLPLQRLHGRPGALAALTGLAGLVALVLGLFWGAGAMRGLLA